MPWLFNSSHLGVFFFSAILLNPQHHVPHLSLLPWSCDQHREQCMDSAVMKSLDMNYLIDRTTFSSLPKVSSPFLAACQKWTRTGGSLLASLGPLLAAKCGPRSYKKWFWGPLFPGPLRPATSFPRVEGRKSASIAIVRPLSLMDFSWVLKSETCMFVWVATYSLKHAFPVFLMTVVNTCYCQLKTVQR